VIKHFESLKDIFIKVYPLRIISKYSFALPLQEGLILWLSSGDQYGENRFHIK